MKRSLFFIVSILSCFILSVAAAKAQTSSCNVAINEVYPNPPGTDTGSEWIEIHNCSDQPINMDGWYLKDKGGGKFPLGGVLQSKGYNSIYPTFSLNQSDESITLYNAVNLVVDNMTYSASNESLTISRIPDGTGSWKENTQPTPGSSNIFIEPDPFKEAEEISISELRGEPTSSKLYLVKGIVTAGYGEIYSDKIYIQDNSGKGILVKLPVNVDVTRNESLTLCGNKASYYNEPILKVEDSLCIKSVEAETIKPSLIDESSQLDDYSGGLIMIEGIIQKTSGESLWIDIQEHLKISIPSTYKISRAKEDELIIQGILIVQQTTDGTTYKLKPRDAADVHVILPSEQLEIKENQKPSIIKPSNLPLLKVPEYKPLNENKYKKIAIKSEKKANENVRFMSFTGLGSSVYGIVAILIKKSP